MASLAPELEARIKDSVMERLRTRLGEQYLRRNRRFIESQWRWAMELGMIDPEVDDPGPYNASGETG